MADEKHSKRPAGAHHVEEPTSDTQALLRHVQENPLVYAGAIGFVVVVLLVTLFFRLAQESGRQDAATAYLEALDTEDVNERVARLGDVAESGTYLEAHALYMQGEAAIEARDYATAREKLTQLRETHPEFPFVPDAVEGLGFVEEEEERFAQARAYYEEVEAKWPDSTAAQRQAFNVGRTYESEGDIAAAIEAYRRQLEVFPGSTIALRAQQRLNALRETHPELFEDESASIVPLASPESDAEDSDSTEDDESQLTVDFDLNEDQP